VPESVAGRPVLFATLTAPSFGAVHRRPGPGGPCQASGPRYCRHGRALFCLQHHSEDDPLLGEALCPECYDFASAVLFNASVSELWRRTVIYTRRHLARLVGVPAKALSEAVRLSYLKVAELQRRGAVHLHVVLRLDAAGEGALPAGLDAGLLAIALRLGAGQVRVPLPGGRGPATWGEQLDCRVVTEGAPEGTVRVANYLAKYSVKGSDSSGALDRRLRGLKDLEHRALPPQLRRLAEAAWRLGGEEALSHLRLRSWAHTLGLRSHFLTKSRRFSTTFKALRAARQAHQRSEHLRRAGIEGPEGEGQFVVLGEWAFAGRGWTRRAEAFLAASEGRRAAEARRFAAEARLLAWHGASQGAGP
jgi:hypothetical protein